MYSPHDLIQSLSVPLPEDIQKLKWAGAFEEAIAAIDRRVGTDIPELLRKRLLVERERLRRMPLQYPYTRQEALAKARELLGDITEREFQEMELDGKLDYIFFHGQKRYFKRCPLSLTKRPEYLRRADPAASPESPWLDPMIAVIRERGHLARRIHLRFSIRPEEEAWREGVYRAWLPCPLESDQQREVRITEGQPLSLSGPDAQARTAYFEGPLKQGEAFSVGYSYVSEIRYADPLHYVPPASPLYPSAPPPTEADLTEDGFVRFTPLMVSLAQQLTQGVSTPLEMAKCIYDFITTRVRYSFMRNYFCVDNYAEFCALNMRGDCGLQALTFVTLCRIAGIPARWQSGMAVEPDYTGSHDWAQFYLEGWGWRFADPSYGGGAFRAGNLERQAFYFGNLDPMRMAANRRYMAQLDPPMVGLRIDPFDNQSGEVERVGADAPFVGRDVDDTARLVCAEAL